MHRGSCRCSSYPSVSKTVLNFPPQQNCFSLPACFHCERNAVDAKEYMGFGVSTSLETVLSGSAGFLCGRENMRPKSRCWLLIVTAVITSATCFQCGLLSILNIQQLSHTRKFNGSASNGSEEEADRNGPDQSSIPPLKISLVVMYLLAGILVAASASLLIYNLVVNRRRYRNPAKTEEMAKKKLMTAESTLMDSDAARRTSDLMRTRSNRSVVTSL